MQSMAVVLPDGTAVQLKENGALEFRFDLVVNGKVECRYDTFQHAWEDFGRMVRCTVLEEVMEVWENLEWSLGEKWDWREFMKEISKEV
jgi:hypothetical protein